MASIVGSRMLVRSGPHRVLPVAFTVSSLLQFGEWLLLGHSARLAACVIYLHMVAFGAVLISGFWSLMNESFEPRSAKELFGRIGGMGTLGGLCGGLLAERVAAWFGARDVVLLLAVLHLICAVMTWRAARFPGHRPYEESRPSSAIDAVQRYPFLLTLAGLVILASSGAALLDFVFKAQAANTIGRGAPLLRFFGVYYTTTSLLTFLTQTLARAFVCETCGPRGHGRNTACLHRAGQPRRSIAPWIPGAQLRFALMEILVRGSLYRTAYELFYAAISPADKRAVKSLIDVGADRTGDAVGSAGVSLMLVLAPGRYGADPGTGMRYFDGRRVPRCAAPPRLPACAREEPRGPCHRARPIAGRGLRHSIRSHAVRSDGDRSLSQKSLRRLTIRSCRRRPAAETRSYGRRPTFDRATRRAPSGPPASLDRTIGRWRR